MGVVGREEGVVEVQLAHRNSVGECGPLRADPQVRIEAEDGRADTSRTRHVRGGLLPGCRRRGPPNRCRCDACVVDDPVDDHLRDLVAHLDGIGGNLGNGPGELPFPWQGFLAAVDPDTMVLHG